MVDELWVPDIYIYNLKELVTGSVIKKLSDLNVARNKTLSYTFAARATVGCNFLFDNFPLDKQTCKFAVGSYAFDYQQLDFEGYFYHPFERQAPLQGILFLHDLTRDERVYNETLPDGTLERQYTTAGFRVVIQRTTLGYFFRTYIPAALMVFVSWISFFIDQTTVLGRTGFLVTLVLTEINLL